MIPSGKKVLLAMNNFFGGQSYPETNAFCSGKILFLLLLLAVLPLFSLYAQDEITIDGQPCGMHGNAKNGEAYALNAYKNRYTAPAKSDFDLNATLANLLVSGDPNQFSQEKAAVVRGYVYDVKPGGVETCNCKTKDLQFRDTHIELTPDENKTGQENRLIVEVTPRLRALMQQKGEDWSTAALRRNIKGKWVEVAGWLTYDVEHETAAFANDPDNAIGQRNWRATVWEVHPITYLKVIDKGSASSLDDILREQAGTKNKQGETTNKKASAKSTLGGHSTLWLIGLGLLVLIAAYFLLKNKIL
jgi:hypothetical protein